MSAAPQTTTSFDCVSGYLAWDHDRLDALLDEAAEQVEEGRWADAREPYGVFERGLDRHMRLEEEIVFPLFEARSGIVDGPTAVLREEHRAIRGALALMRGGILDSDAQAFRDGIAFFHTVMPEHDAKEEHFLYPMTDRMLTDRERATLVARLRRE